MILYHGTSDKRLRRILKMDMLETQEFHSSICFSTRYKPAHYWSNLSALDDESVPVILKLNAIKLLEEGYDLFPYSDPVYGEGICDWEYEVRVIDDIHPLSMFLISHGIVPLVDINQLRPAALSNMFSDAASQIE